MTIPEILDYILAYEPQMKVTPYGRLMFQVESESLSGVTYLVDLSDGNGDCDCLDFLARKKKQNNATCKHIRFVKNYLADQVVEALKKMEKEK